MAEAGPSIKDLSQGYSYDGVSEYLEQIKAKCLTDAAEKVKATETIKAVCDAEWAGKAKENFKINLDKDAEHVVEQLTSLYAVLESEIWSLAAAYSNKDEVLIQTEE